MTTRRHVLGALAGAGFLPTAFAAVPSSQALKDIAHSKGMRFGTAVGAGPKQFGDPAYMALVARECNLIVAENQMKWPALQPGPDAYRFGPADDLVAWATKNGIQVRGHNLFWQEEKWLPPWLAKADFGSQGAPAVERLMREHVKSVCEHFGPQVGSWDVVNEAIDPADGALRQNPMTRPLGAVEQIDLAFRLAHEYAPHAQLVYNDYMLGDPKSAKHRASVLELLAALRKRGTPIHALGLQAHIGALDPRAERKHDPAAWRRFLDEVTGMGFDLLITELDVNDRALPADLNLRDAGVASAARDFLDQTLSYPRLRDVLVWGMADHISWLQNLSERATRADKLPMRPCPYDASLRAKPLRHAIADAIRSAPARAA